MATNETQTQDLLAAGRWQEMLRAGPTFRLVPTHNGRQALQRYEGFFGSSGHLWRTLHGGPIECPALAADLLAVAEGRMTREEQAKRWRSRKRAAKRRVA